MTGLVPRVDRVEQLLEQRRECERLGAEIMAEVDAAEKAGDPDRLIPDVRRFLATYNARKGFR